MVPTELAGFFIVFFFTNRWVFEVLLSQRAEEKAFVGNYSLGGTEKAESTQ